MHKNLLHLALTHNFKIVTTGLLESIIELLSLQWLLELSIPVAHPILASLQLQGAGTVRSKMWPWNTQRPWLLCIVQNLWVRTSCCCATNTKGTQLLTQLLCVDFHCLSSLASFIPWWINVTEPATAFMSVQFFCRWHSVLWNVLQLIPWRKPQHPSFLFWLQPNS